VTSSAVDVTVVIPTRNRARLLAEALRSALSQVDVALEVQIVDDASTDETAALLDTFPDQRVKTIRLVSARGVAAARNLAAAEATGEWLAFLDDDDLWAPDVAANRRRNRTSEPVRRRLRKPLGH
jgi:glycosyltransferase involved in cell wall biosynthesis